MIIEHFRENSIYWIIMFVSFFILLVYFKANITEILKILLTWTFAVSSYKIFIEDLAIKKIGNQK